MFVCKIHPYMTAVVAVTDAAGNIPDVTATALPFLSHLGVTSLPATSVLGVITTVAPDDATKLAKWDIFGPSAALIPAVKGVGEVWVNSQFERVPGQVDDHVIATENRRERSGRSLGNQDRCADNWNIES